MSCNPDPPQPPDAEPQPALDLNQTMHIATPLTLSRPPTPAMRDDAAFDTWVRRELARAHEHILREPVPERLLRLLRPLPGN